MNLNTSITKLLSEIRDVHNNLPSRDQFPIHIEIFSSDTFVGLHQFVGKSKNLTLMRYIDEPNGFFDLELLTLLTNYLRMIQR